MNPEKNIQANFSKIYLWTDFINMLEKMVKNHSIKSEYDLGWENAVWELHDYMLEHKTDSHISHKYIWDKCLSLKKDLNKYDYTSLYKYTDGWNSALDTILEAGLESLTVINLEE